MWDFRTFSIKALHFASAKSRIFCMLVYSLRPSSKPIPSSSTFSYAEASKYAMRVVRGFGGLELYDTAVENTCLMNVLKGSRMVLRMRPGDTYIGGFGAVAAGGVGGADDAAGVRGGVAMPREHVSIGPSHFTSWDFMPKSCRTSSDLAAGLASL